MERKAYEGCGIVMALKGATGKLYLLLGACLPNDERIKAKIAYNEIIESSKYRMLRENPNAKFLLEGVYSKSSLMQLTNVQLEQVMVALPQVEIFIVKLVQSIKYGQAWSLKPADRPNFYDVAQIKNTIKKLSNVSKKENTTNISEHDMMQVFSNDTIKDIDELIASQDYMYIGSLAERIPTILSGKLYCFDTSKLESKVAAAVKEINELNELGKGLKIAKRKIRSKKFLVTIISIMLIALLAGTNILTSVGTSVFIVAFLLLLLVFWIVG